MAIARYVCSVEDCSGNCSRGCTSCLGTCTDTCTGTCTGSCSSCTGTCTGGCSGCSGSCSGTCKGSCSNGCTTTCTKTCNNFCNAGCEESAMAFTVTEIMKANNMQDLADLVFFELARRPTVSMDSVNGLFVQNNKIYLNNFTGLIAALSNIGKSLNTTDGQGTKAMKSFINEIVNKLLAANAENVPID